MQYNGNSTNDKFNSLFNEACTHLLLLHLSLDKRVCDKNEKIESFQRTFTSLYLVLHQLNNSQKVHQVDQFFYKSGNLVGGKLKSENRP